MFNTWPKYRRVLVNLDDDRAIDGLLIAVRGPLLVLADASLLVPGREPAPMDGHIYIERTRVIFLQASPGRS
jgi:small nuclear ribonucleoprotein (snRNP)-like protein